MQRHAFTMLNESNSRLMALITGKSAHAEAIADARTFEIVRWVRARRLQWVGHILRIDPEHMVHETVHHVVENREDGDLLMDVPVDLTYGLRCVRALRTG